MFYGVSDPSFSAMTRRRYSQARGLGLMGDILYNALQPKRKRFKYTKKSKASKKLSALLAQPLEIGFHDTVYSNQTLTTTPIVTLLNGLTKGSSASTRSSFRTRMLSLQIRWFVKPASLGTAQSIRCVVVYDKSPDKAALTQALVYDSISTLSPTRMENSGRFSIIMSRFFCLSGNDATGLGHSGPMVACETKFIKLKNLATRYDSDTNLGDITEIIEGSLYLIFWGSNITTAGAIVSVHTRLRFTG